MSTGAFEIDPRLRARRVEVLRHQGQRRLRRLLAVVALVATALVIVVVSRSRLFDVDSIAVEGAERTSVEEVHRIADPLLSEPLLEVQVSTVTDEIATLPWVDDVRASRSLDGTVTLTVTERTAVAALVGVEGWLLVDVDGRVLDAVDRLPADVVVVDGAVWNAQPGDWVSERALPGVELASLLPATLEADVASVRFGDDIELALFGGGTVLLGDLDDLDDKFLATLTMLDQVPLTCLDHIDVRAPTVPVLTRLPDCS